MERKINQFDSDEAWRIGISGFVYDNSHYSLGFGIC